MYIYLLYLYLMQVKMLNQKNENYLDNIEGRKMFSYARI